MTLFQRLRAEWFLWRLDKRLRREAGRIRAYELLARAEVIK